MIGLKEEWTSFEKSWTAYEKSPSDDGIKGEALKEFKGLVISLGQKAFTSPGSTIRISRNLIVKVGEEQVEKLGKQLKIDRKTRQKVVDLSKKDEAQEMAAIQKVIQKSKGKMDAVKDKSEQEKYSAGMLCTCAEFTTAISQAYDIVQNLTSDGTEKSRKSAREFADEVIKSIGGEQAAREINKDRPGTVTPEEVESIIEATKAQEENSAKNTERRKIVAQKLSLLLRKFFAASK